MRLKIAFGLMFIAALIGALTIIVDRDVKAMAECTARGGEYHYISHTKSLCLKPGTVLQ